MAILRMTARFAAALRSRRQYDLEDREEDLKKLFKSLRSIKNTVENLIGRIAHYLGVGPELQQIVDVIENAKIPDDPDLGM